MSLIRGRPPEGPDDAPPRTERGPEYALLERSPRGYIRKRQLVRGPLSPVPDLPPAKRQRARERTTPSPPAPSSSARSTPERTPGEEWQPGGMRSTFHIFPNKMHFSVGHMGLEYRAPRPPAQHVSLVKVDYETADRKVTIRGEGEEVVGRGSFGRVVRLGSALVAKVARIEEPESRSSRAFTDQFPAMLMDEAAVCIRLRHPNVLRFLRSFLCVNSEKEVLAVHLMESLQADVRSMNLDRRPESFFRTIEYDCLLALRYMHSRGILHRDIKPNNILFLKVDERTPSPYIFKLGDMGAISNNLSQVISGTYQYLGPECVTTKVQLPSSDVWALYTSLWEIRHKKVPMLGVFPDVSTTTEAAQRWRQLLREDGSLYNHVVSVLLEYWGAPTDPTSTYLLISEKKTTLEKARSLKEPNLQALFAYHSRVYGIPTDIGTPFGRGLEMVLQASEKRPSAEELLNMLSEGYFAGISPRRDVLETPKERLPTGVTADGYSSVWYVEGKSTASPDDFRMRRALGTQSIYSGMIPKIGVPELFPPKHKPVRVQKYAREMRPQDLKAAGNNYYLFRWEGNHTLMCVPVVTVFAPDFLSLVKTFCREVISVSQKSASALPFVEFFLEMRGPTTLIYLVMAGEWRHIGSRSFDGPEEWLTLALSMAGFKDTIFAGDLKMMAGQLLASNMWVGRGHRFPRLNLATMFHSGIGNHSLSAMLQGRIGEGRRETSLAKESREFTSLVCWRTMARYHVSGDFQARWQRPFEEGWDSVMAAIRAEGLELPADPPVDASMLDPSVRSPRFALSTYDTVL